MTVQIKIHKNFSFLLEGSNQLFNSEINGMKRFIGSFPSSIEILSCQRTPIITIDNSIRVKNGHNFKDKVISKSPSLRRFAYQIVNESLHHPTGIAFTRMDSSTYENSFLGFRFGASWVLIFACN